MISQKTHQSNQVNDDINANDDSIKAKEGAS
jgi:hypothetical protein